MLISQLEHARLSGILAEHWGAPGFAPLVERGPVCWVATHHDDGWQPWEERPQVNAAGQPRAFVEMDLADSLAIWTRSIELAASTGLLEGYLVAGHFCALGRRGAVFLKAYSDRQLAEAFLARYEVLMAELLAAWCELDAANTPDRAALALRQLQMFDALSLWFCCTPDGDSETLETPGGAPLTLRRLPGEVVELDPWPLAVERLNIEIRGRRVPARRYPTAAELAQVDGRAAKLAWQLRPGGPKS